jgi:small-conductance mechanosensitive channel
MDWKTIGQAIGNAMDVKLFKLGETQVTGSTLFAVLIIILATYLLSRWSQRGLERLLVKSGVKKESTILIIRRTAHYLIVLTGIVASLQTVGIDLSTLFAAGAVFAVGLAFAMQTIAQNFVSGIILLIERTIKQGDVLEVEGQLVKVISMRIRSTLVRTRDEEEIIVPNSLLVQGMVKNYTMSDSAYLLATTVGVVYGSDMKKVREILEGTIGSLPFDVDQEKSGVLMREFGNSSVDFRVFVMIDDPWRARRLRSKLNEAIWWALKDADITIAFPQLDVHFDSAVEKTFDLVASRGNA